MSRRWPHREEFDRGDIDKQSAKAVEGDHQNAVKWERNRGERDPGVGSIGKNMSAIASHLEAMDASSKEFHPKAWVSS